MVRILSYKYLLFFLGNNSKESSLGYNREERGTPMERTRPSLEIGFRHGCQVSLAMFAVWQRTTDKTSAHRQCLRMREVSSQ
jgi:hypothetical protein